MDTPLVDGWILLAQDAEGAGGSPLTGFLPIIVIMVLFYFILLRPQQKKQQEARSMIDNLKEKDRVVTIGGIHGVVTNVQREQEVVTLRIDESTGAKLRVATSAISRIVTDDDKKDKSN